MIRVALASLAAALLPASSLAQSGELARPSANITTERALCGQDWISLSLRSTREGLSASDVQIPKGDSPALAHAVTEALKDMKVVSTIRIYCGGGSYFLEVSGYTAWTGDAAPIVRRFTLAPAGLRVQD
ncbi:hypothetical protein [Caulobacter sp. 1776]|uniref:hypothetical protein n=1 Tax=Caulobacter sp. 1776 TaxID=3156420 RepID=UPI003395C4EF